MKKIIFAAFAVTALLWSACNSNEGKEKNTTPVIVANNVTYKADSVSMIGYVAYDSNSIEKRPAVLIVPEWWGVNDYTRNRAKQLAELGYVAFVVDMYGNGQTADSPSLAGKLATPFYENPQMAKQRFDAALALVKTYSQTDTSKIAAIGYCFGGSMVLNMAKMGDDLDGVVSFHGDLRGVPADKNLLKAKILVCHGWADKFVDSTQVAAFKKEMDSIKADYTFKGYADATHAFTNPDATKAGQRFGIPIAYNAAADTASWKEMRTFFDKIFK